MKPNPHGGDFRQFPYRPDYEGGRTNNGGINLVLEPHRIDEISEASSFRELRDFFGEVNGEGSRLMTLGCEAGIEGELFQGYIEFTVRPEYAQHSRDLLRLDTQFVAFTKQVGDSEVDWDDYWACTLAWESAEFSFKTTPDVTQHKVSVWFRFHDQDQAADFVSALHAFLMDHVAIPSLPKI